MEELLELLCGKKDYMIIQCQKVTKEELSKKLFSLLKAERTNAFEEAREMWKQNEISM